MSVNLRALIGKLNDPTRGALESAAGLCLARTHYDVEVEHFLMKLLDVAGSDLQAIMKHYGLDRSRLAQELTRSLDRLKSGNARTPSLSPQLVKAFTDAWTIASIDFGASKIRTGHVVLALVSNEELARVVKDVSKELAKVAAEDLHAHFAQRVSGSLAETDARRE